MLWCEYFAGSLLAVVFGFAADLIFGDPLTRLHPICLIGNLIAVLEKGIRKIFPKTKAGELFGGCVMALLVIGISTGTPALVLVLAYRVSIYLGVAVEAVMCFFLFAVKSLKKESMNVKKALEKDGLEAGRKAVSRIVGRDTQSLSEKGVIKAAVENAGAQIITLAVRRTNTKKNENILDYIPDHVTLLPNTSGARDAKEAVRIAKMARELGCGNFVKVEIMKDSKYLLPDNVETVKATEMLAKEGFVVLPYMYPELYTARDLANAGAAAVMPLAAPIGSNKGLATKEFIQILIDEIDLPVIVDAGIGKPSQACEAMEMGAAAIMANTAIATAGDIPAMAGAFKNAIEAGRAAYLAGLGRVLERGASASDPLTGFLRD